MKCEMMVDIDQIWADVDTLRGCEPTRESEEGHTRNSAFLKAAVCASCGGAKVVTCEGMPVCQECGLVENMYMHEGAEWISSYGEDGVITDNSRCPLLNAPGSFQRSGELDDYPDESHVEGAAQANGKDQFPPIHVSQGQGFIPRVFRHRREGSRHPGERSCARQVHIHEIL